MKIVLLLVILFISLSHWMASANTQQNKADKTLTTKSSKYMDSSVVKNPHLGFNLISKAP